MQIFVTVGAQMPFDRLIAAVDRWAEAHPGHTVRAQIGESALRPAHLAWSRMMSPAELGRAYDDADVIVGHAGTGTIFAALEREKPLVVMPRRAALGETRNDHQIATAERLGARLGVTVAWDERELVARLATLDHVLPSRALAPEAGGALVRAIAAFIDGRLE
jgi:UDP-N-acetylglucosamine transferase subunit ALG13